MSRPEDLNQAILAGRGTGKSLVLLLLALQHALRWPGARVLLIRRSLPAARELKERLVEIFSAAMPGARFDSTAHTMHCPNGSLVEIGFLEGPSDLQRYMGRECTLLMFDEVTLFGSLDPLWKLRGNLRNSRGIPTRTVIAGMPGGPSHAAVVAKFITGRQPRRPFALDQPGNAPGTDEWMLIDGTLDDNPTLPASYPDTLLAACNGDPAMYSGWRFGNFESVGGQFFTQFGEHNIVRGDPDWRVPKWNVDPERFKYSGTVFDERNYSPWVTWWAIDHGISAPAVALAFAAPRRLIAGPAGIVMPPRSAFIVAEVHSADPSDPSRGLNWSVDMMADAVKEASELFGIARRGCVDDARGLGTDETVISEFRRCGVNLVRALKGSRSAGWTKLKNMMQSARVRDPDAPWAMIHERCKYTIETVSQLGRDPRRVDECDNSPGSIDHAADAWRYGATHPIPIGGAPATRPLLY